MHEFFEKLSSHFDHGRFKPVMLRTQVEFLGRGSEPIPKTVSLCVRVSFRSNHSNHQIGLLLGIFNANHHWLRFCFRIFCLVILQCKMGQFLYRKRILEKLSVFKVAIFEFDVSKSILLFDFAFVYNRAAQSNNSHLHLFSQFNSAHQQLSIVHPQI